MTPHETRVELADVPLFEGLSPDERAQILDLAEPVALDAGEVIVHQGRQSQRLWLLVEGTCEVCLRSPGGEPVVLATLEPHATFGEMSFFHAAPHSASVRAKSAVRLLRIERERYEALRTAGSLAAYKLALNTVGQLAERLRRMDEWVARLVETKNGKAPAAEWDAFRARMFDSWKL